MSNKTIIEKRVSLNPSFLGKNYKNALIKKIKDLCENDCTQEYGYIIEVKMLNKIKDNYISNVNSDILFNVEFEAITLKPEIGSIFTDKVCMVYNCGIFVNIKDKMKVLIPLTSLKEYKFDSNKKIFYNKETKKEIQEGCDITVIITGLKYSKKNFSCYGELKEI